ncbi:MAG TPA: GNAT family N-acetyltransferase [Acidimicrobiales bacterium]|nr:GNAT family N-acetyltransferase [Acidimicrobiales bacterium]
MPAAGQIIRWGTERARTGKWRADGSVAFLAPLPDGRAPSPEFVRQCLRMLAKQGYERVVTGALAPFEQQVFLDAGFAVHEPLHLLVLDHTVAVPPVPPGPRLRRAGARRREGVLEVDAAAFSSFWRLDRAGLGEALEATPRHRLRVVLGDGRRVVGYAICGAASSRGFVQRLAVDPKAQRRGLGQRLLLDGVHWLRTQGTSQIAVNTQYGNRAALALYHKVGFRDDPEGLCVLSAPLGSSILG